MALPSILLLLTFVVGVLATTGSRWSWLSDRTHWITIRSSAACSRPFPRQSRPARPGCTGSVSGFRSRSPLAQPRSPAIAVGLLVAALGENAEQAKNVILGFVLALGIGVFLFAMWWDGSDRARLTRRADVAFWLHLLAAPMIVHPVFTLLGLNDGNATIGEGLVVILLYVVLGLTALAIDRRALLVSALAYVLFAHAASCSGSLARSSSTSR